MDTVYVVSPEFSGYLTKRGFYWRKQWKKRWVVLHGTEIAYMDKKPENSNSNDGDVTRNQITVASEIIPEDIDDDPNGFAININDFDSHGEPKTPTWYLRASSPEEKKEWLSLLFKLHGIVCWLDFYEKIRVLGTGGSGIVYELKHKRSGQRYALKEMEMKNREQLKCAVREAEMLMEITQHISHPNIMRIEKVFQVGDKFYMVFPLCTGGELYETIVKRKHFTEFDAACLMRDLIGALAELHRNDILHLDIKPENILFTTEGLDATIKLTDFGLSKALRNIDKSTSATNTTDNKDAHTSTSPSSVYPSKETLDLKLKTLLNVGLNMDRVVGTIGYMSPEILLTSCFNKAADIWASGVILYILLSGMPPFASRSNRDVIERSAKGEYSLQGHEWEHVSEDAKDLIRKMLTFDPSSRITAEEVLNHPWIRMVCDDVDEGEENDEVGLHGHVGDDGVQRATESMGKLNTTGEDDMASNNASPAVVKRLSLSPMVFKKANSTMPPSPLQERRQSASNTTLNVALTRLSSLVQERKVEKIASNINRFISTLQHPQLNSSSPTKANTSKARFPLFQVLNARLKRSVDDTKVTPSAGLEHGAGDSNPPVSENPFDNIIANTQIREMILQMFRNTDTTTTPLTPNDISNSNYNKISVEQLGSLFSKMYSGDNPTSILMMCRFIDSDNDGYISSEDIFVAEAKMQQNSIEFLKIIFRAYIDSVWYPGRNLNIANITRNNNKVSGNITSNAANSINTNGGSNAGGAASTPGKSILSSDSNVFSPSDVIEPPKYITAKNVSAVFDRLGYGADAGRDMFNELCSMLSEYKCSKAKRRQMSGCADDADNTLSANAELQSSTLTDTSPAPPAASSVPEKPGFKFGATASNLATLVDRVGAVAGMALGRNIGNEDSDDEFSSDGKMDFEDFLTAALEVDDILVTAVKLGFRIRFSSMVKDAKGLSSQPPQEKASEQQQV